MSINFFPAKCQIMLNDAEFGIRDDSGTDPAYTDVAEKDRWIASVENRNRYEVTFTAIDNCVEILRADGSMDSRCDGILTYSDDIIFVECKEMVKDWITGGTEQLRSTIILFSKNHNLQSYNGRRAYLTNRRHPNFHYSHKEAMQQFRNQTSVRLILAAKIIL